MPFARSTVTTAATRARRCSRSRRCSVFPGRGASRLGFDAFSSAPAGRDRATRGGTTLRSTSAGSCSFSSAAAASSWLATSPPARPAIPGRPLARLSQGHGLGLDSLVPDVLPEGVRGPRIPVGACVSGVTRMCTHPDVAGAAPIRAESVRRSDLRVLAAQLTGRQRSGVRPNALPRLRSRILRARRCRGTS
jgi:hypothetical protein